MYQPLSTEHRCFTQCELKNVYWDVAHLLQFTGMWPIYCSLLGCGPSTAVYWDVAHLLQFFFPR